MREGRRGMGEGGIRLLSIVLIQKAGVGNKCPLASMIEYEWSRIKSSPLN